LGKRVQRAGKLGRSRRNGRERKMSRRIFSLRKATRVQSVSRKIQRKYGENR
jgi:hypothetical protein